MLTLEHLSVCAGNNTLLCDINISFKKGKIYALLGPNGSGKSTLVHSIVGNPAYTVEKDSKLHFNGKDISSLSPDKRSQLGFFMTFQHPPALGGVSVKDLLRVAVGKKMSAMELHKKIELLREELTIPDELLKRSLNEGFSGGERKKMECLQLGVLDPQIVFLDEIDTGVDVDSLNTIASFLKKFMTKEKTMVIITHHAKILEFLTPDHVLVVKDGSIATTGGPELVPLIEKSGYQAL